MDPPFDLSFDPQGEQPARQSVEGRGALESQHSIESAVQGRQRLDGCHATQT